MLRMRVEAAASARFARAAPWVMLPASTTCRNRLRSGISNRKFSGSLRSPSDCGAPSEMAKAAYSKSLLRGIMDALLVRGFRNLTVFQTARSSGSGGPIPACRQPVGSRLRNQAIRSPRPAGVERMADTPPRGRKAALAPSQHLPADADDDDVDRASHHRGGAVLRHPAADLVAAGGGIRARPPMPRSRPSWTASSAC